MRVCIIAAAVLALAAAQTARAQLSSMIPGSASGGVGGGMGSSMGGAMGAIGGMGGGLPSLSSASPSNIAGILQYCVQNNDLTGGNANSAASVQQSLLQKVDGTTTPPSSDEGFSSGSNGQLSTGNGQSLALGGNGLQGAVTQKICNQVLSRARSLL
jgi:hypothetical protein